MNATDVSRADAAMNALDRLTRSMMLQANLVKDCYAKLLTLDVT